MSREVCGICWCPYDEDTGECACEPEPKKQHMTTLRTAAQQALEALEEVQKYGTTTEWFDERVSALKDALAEPEPPPEAQTEAEKIAYCAGWWDAMAKARKAEPVQEPVWVCPDSAEHRYQKPGHCEDCGKTLVQVAEPAQEPVAWKDKIYETLYHQDFGNSIPLYTTPPQRKPLTDEEMRMLGGAAFGIDITLDGNLMAFGRAIERAHNITGDNT